MTYVDPAVIDDETQFAPRDPEAAPLWLQIVCGLIMIGIWGITFYEIGRM